MNFEGRYYTRNETIVTVHAKLVDSATMLIIEYWGHSAQAKAPFEDNKLLLWDSRGNCTRVDSIKSFDGDLRDFDLACRVNPQSYEAGIEVIGCEECTKERREKS